MTANKETSGEPAPREAAKELAEDWARLDPDDVIGIMQYALLRGLDAEDRMDDLAIAIQAAAAVICVVKSETPEDGDLMAERLHDNVRGLSAYLRKVMTGKNPSFERIARGLDELLGGRGRPQ